VSQPYHLAKRVQLTLTGSPIHTFQRAQDEHRTLSLSLHRRGGESQTQSVQNLTPKRHEIGCQLLVITNRKSHTDLKLVPTSIIESIEARCSCMMLNGVIACTIDYRWVWLHVSLFVLSLSVLSLSTGSTIQRLVSDESQRPNTCCLPQFHRWQLLMGQNSVKICRECHYSR